MFCRSGGPLPIHSLPILYPSVTPRPLFDLTLREKVSRRGIEGSEGTSPVLRSWQTFSRLPFCFYCDTARLHFVNGPQKSENQDYICMAVDLRTLMEPECEPECEP